MASPATERGVTRQLSPNRSFQSFRGTRQSGTNVHEICDGIYRINTPVEIAGAGEFSFNQYLIRDDEPLLFHTGRERCSPWREKQWRVSYPSVAFAISHFRM